MKAYGELDVQIHIFLTSAVAGVEWSASRLDHFTREERAPGTHWIRGRVDSRAGLGDVVQERKANHVNMIHPCCYPVSSKLD
jgi:hypothetical protein